MFEAIVETLPAQLIVIDPQTHELLYANTAARKMWEEARKGNKCYSILGKSAPSDFCKTSRLSLDDYLQSERDGSDGRRFGTSRPSLYLTVHGPDARNRRSGALENETE